jgi:hypothetical protein
MLDVHACIRQVLLADSTISTLTAGKVSWPDLPAGFDPAKGQKALTFFVRGGPFNPELSKIAEPSIQVRAWSLKMPDAMALFAAAFDLLDQAERLGNASGEIISAYAETPAQPSYDPEVGWATVTGFFKLFMRDTVGSAPAVIPGLVSSGRHFSLEALDGIRMSFTFLGLPSDPNKYLLMYNGQGMGSGFTQIGDVITFDTITPDASQNDELFCFY